MLAGFIFCIVKNPLILFATYLCTWRNQTLTLLLLRKRKSNRKVGVFTLACDVCSSTPAYVCMDMGAGVSVFVSVTPIERYHGLFLFQLPFVYDEMCEVFNDYLRECFH